MVEASTDYPISEDPRQDPRRDPSKDKINKSDSNKQQGTTKQGKTE